MERIILHVDVNNAYLSWTAIWLLKNGHKTDIRERYAVIGGDESQRRGIVLAKSTALAEFVKVPTISPVSNFRILTVIDALPFLSSVGS